VKPSNHRIHIIVTMEKNRYAYWVDNLV
jgi:hypothetical protein